MPIIGYTNRMDDLDNEERIIEVIPYCRTCNSKLRTKGGSASHRNQGHEVLQMKIQEPSPNYKHSQVIMKSAESNPYELIHNIDYSKGSKSL